MGSFMKDRADKTGAKNLESKSVRVGSLAGAALFQTTYFMDTGGYWTLEL
jgi:hypothetical protein